MILFRCLSVGPLVPFRPYRWLWMAVMAARTAGHFVDAAIYHVPISFLFATVRWVNAMLAWATVVALGVFVLPKLLLTQPIVRLEQELRERELEEERIARAREEMEAAEDAIQGVILERISRAREELERRANERAAELEVANRSLREHERRFRAVFDQTFEMMAILDTDGRLLEVNQTGLEFGGVKREEMVKPAVLGGSHPCAGPGRNRQNARGDFDGGGRERDTI